MMNSWTTQEITKILIQLDERKMPFENYSFVREESGLNLLGRGGSADVYEAVKREKNDRDYAIKVIGFKKQHVDSAAFHESVKAQTEVGDSQKDILKIYDHTELWVTLDEQDNVLTAEREKPGDTTGRCIKLQFIVMEKVVPILERAKSGEICLLPENLKEWNQDEVLRLACDIGAALQRAHESRILHRDIKLENIFYSEEEKRYKLGDFGIAKRTEDGFANTVAFTQGYAAPEVLHAPDHERYDNTADIYSLGMVLFLLMNELQFPDSNSYHVNHTEQYRKGYVLPAPVHASTDFYHVIARMCMYDPDDRYQSMAEVLRDIEKLIYGELLGYAIEHKKRLVIVGIISLVFSIIAWKLTIAPQLELTLTFWEYTFLVLCLGKCIYHLLKMETGCVSVFVLGIGFYLIKVSGFSWLKLLFVIMMSFYGGLFTGCVSGGVLLTNFIYLMQKYNDQMMTDLKKYNWLAVLFLIVAISMFMLYEDYQHVQIARRPLFKKDYYLVTVCAFYIVLIAFSLIQNSGWYDYTLFYSNKAFRKFIKWIIHQDIVMCVVRWWISQDIDLYLVGLCGFLFTLLWIVRRRIDIWNNK